MFLQQNSGNPTSFILFLDVNPLLLLKKFMGYIMDQNI